MMKRMTRPVCHLRVELRVLPMHTRFPFRYGIASLTALPHLFVHSEVDVNGQISAGVASEGLPPKWFSKNPATNIEQDLADMIAVIQNAARLTPMLTRQPVSFFEYWLTLQKELGTWAFKQGFSPLLTQLGVSLMERSILDAICKARQRPLHQLILDNDLEIDIGSLHGGLADLIPSDYLLTTPLSSTQVRHTIGLSDSLRADDIPAEERLNDGLPQALDESISAYGLRYFKIKLSGVLSTDQERLLNITQILDATRGDDYTVTLDGNENFSDITRFREYYQQLQRDENIARLLERTLWVEQPIHRNTALHDSVGPALAAWRDAPAILIDESDSGTADVIKALKLGYSGVSHKNCKGIIKGIANAAIIHHHRRLHPKRKFILSGEDLANVGPVALTQDLAMQAMLGIKHVERNGHHYFKGLSMYSPEINEAVLASHADLYKRHEVGFATLNIHDGQISLESVNSAPFGCNFSFPMDSCPTVKEWIMQGGWSEVV